MLFALICSVLGYLLAAFSPFWFGSSSSVNAAGSITVLSGILLGGCIILAPRYGVISKKLRQVNIAIDITLEDLLGILFRISEQMPEVKLQYAEVKKLFGAKLAFLGLRRAKARGVVEVNKGVIMLTPDGLKMSKGLVRKHRLWESYLVSSLGLRDDHVHPRATQFEHFTSGELAKQLARKEHFPVKDPHGKIIPPED
jgi:Mn-dependent DtxR family transcriptional regulator